jgi:hypothetical protein
MDHGFVYGSPALSARFILNVCSLPIEVVRQLKQRNLEMHVIAI